MTGRRQWCDACDLALQEHGRIGRCDHDYPGRPVEVFWTKRSPDGRQEVYRIALVRAATYATARTLLDENRPGRIGVVHQGDLLAVAAGLEVGEVAEVEADQLPTVSGDWRGRDRR